MPSTWAVTKPCHYSYGKTLFAILGKGKGFQIKIMFHLFFRNKFNGGGEGSREAKINPTLHQVKLLRVSQNERLGSEALESLRNTPLKTTPTEQSSFSMTERHVKASQVTLSSLVCLLSFPFFFKNLYGELNGRAMFHLYRILLCVFQSCTSQLQFSPHCRNKVGMSHQHIGTTTILAGSEVEKEIPSFLSMFSLIIPACQSRRENNGHMEILPLHALSALLSSGQELQRNQGWLGIVLMILSRGQNKVLHHNPASCYQHHCPTLVWAIRETGCRICQCSGKGDLNTWLLLIRTWDGSEHDSARH